MSMSKTNTKKAFGISHMKQNTVLLMLLITVSFVLGWISLSPFTAVCVKAAVSENMGIESDEAVSDGWVTDQKGYRYYYMNGAAVTGWQTIGGKTYYFRKSSKNAPKGSAVTGLIKIDGYRYYFTSSGKMCTGWKTVDGNTYYFRKGSKTAPKGSAVTGLIKIDGYRYYFTSGGKMRTGWKTINGNTYYFRKSSKTAPKGSAVTGLVTISGYQYYFSSSGIMQTGKIVGSADTGYYYVDDSGKVVTSQAIQLAVDFVMAHSSAALSNSARLQTCFEYMRSTYSYKRDYATPGAADLSDYAVSYFTNKSGNCYRYAASVACIAKVLGYETRVAVGKIESSYGGMTAHGWAEVYVDGTWYICDVNFNAYMKTTATYPRTLQANNRYTLTISDGKAAWT